MIDHRFLYSHVTGRPDTGPRGGREGRAAASTSAAVPFCTEGTTSPIGQLGPAGPNRTDSTNRRTGTTRTEAAGRRGTGQDFEPGPWTGFAADFDHDFDHTVPGNATIRAARHEGERCPD